MIVVSDTTAITTLLKAGEEHLLRELFGTVTIPQAVWDELHAFHPGLPEFIGVAPSHRTGPPIAGNRNLGSRRSGSNQTDQGDSRRSAAGR